MAFPDRRKVLLSSRSQSRSLLVSPNSCYLFPLSFIWLDYAGDALSLAEINRPPYSLQALGLAPTPPLPEGVSPPTKIFISSPNISWILDISRDSQVTHIRKDGRFYTHDFTLFPQHYFADHPHLPFVRTKPAESDPPHPLALIWYNFHDQDFILESNGVGDLFRLRPALVSKFVELRQELCNKVNQLISDRGGDPYRFRNMRHSQRGMINTSVCLRCAPQSRYMTLLTATSFQRFYLETLAWFDLFDRWDARMGCPTTNVTVDDTIIGAWTCTLDIAETFRQAGIPVWLARGPHQVTSSLNVASLEGAILPPMVQDIYPNTAFIYNSPPTPFRNRISLSLCVASVEIGPSAREYYPSDPTHLENGISYFSTVWISSNVFLC